MNAENFWLAVYNAGKRLLATLSRQSVADTEFLNQREADIAARRVTQAEVSDVKLDAVGLALVRNAAKSTTGNGAATLSTSLKTEPVLKRVAAYVALFESRLTAASAEQPTMTRSSDTSNEQLRVLWGDLGPKPKELPRPSSFTYREFWRLLEDYKRILDGLLNDARPDLKRAKEDAMAFLQRSVSYLSALHAKFHYLSGILRRDQSQGEKRKLQDEKSTIVRAIAAVLESAKSHAAPTPFKSFPWPDAKQFCHAESPMDVLPQRLFLTGNSTEKDCCIAHLAHLYAKAQRRGEDAALARDAVHSLVDNYRLAIVASKSLVSKAKEMLRRPRVSEGDVEGLLTHTGLLSDGPFSAPRPFVEDGRIAPSVVACLQSLIMRSESFVTRVSKLLVKAEHVIGDFKQICAKWYLHCDRFRSCHFLVSCPRGDFP
jgi:hypothetical protein